MAGVTLVANIVLMKTAISFFALLLVVTEFSCKKIADITKFNLPYQTEATIEAGVATLLPFDLQTPQVTTASDADYQGYKTARKLVQSVTLNSLRLTVQRPEKRTFDFLKKIEVYISADEHAEILLATKDNIPDNVGNQLELEPTSEELKKYLTSDKFNLRLKVTTDKIVNQDVNIKIDANFKIDANVMGL